MTKKTKKGLIITLSVIVGLFLILLIAPFAFKGQIMNVAKKEVNKMLNAKVEFDDISLSFIRNFPNASVRIDNLRIIGTDDFEKDTLLATKNISAVINLKSLFSDSGYEIKNISANDAKVYAHILTDGRPNWDIMKVDSAEIVETDTTDMSFNLKLQKVQLNNADIVYNDEEGQMKADINGVNFSTSGDFTADSSLLKSSLTIESLTFVMEKIEYLSKANLDIKADINANLNNMIFAFSENTSRINAIEFTINGWVQMLDPEGFDMDLSLDAQKVDFKSILSMIPAIYNNQFDGLKAEGDVGLTAQIKGKMLEETFPAFDLNLTVDNGWFQYPDLPKSLKDVNVALRINSPTDNLEEMIIDLSKLSFNMGGNIFQGKAHIEQAMTDPNITASAKGKIDLGMVKDFYPLEAGMNLNGVFNLDLDLATRMSYFENQFEKIKFGGNMGISNLLLEMPDMPNEISIPTAQMVFNNRYVDLSQLQVKIGRNDFSANGKLENFIPYALSDKMLKGQLSLSSNYLNISDFMSGDAAETEESDEPMSVIELPKNINFTMQANIKELVYEKMNFTNAKGVLKLADGVLTFQNLGLEGFGGSVNANGSYDALNPEKPALNLDLNLANVAFAKVFEQIDFVQKFAPIFQDATGDFSAKLSLNTALGKDMLPDLMSLIADGSITTKSVGFKEIPALTALAQNLNKPELANTVFKNLSLLFSIKDGRVDTKPFDVNIGTVKLHVGGSTGLDQSLAYEGTAKLPDNLNLGRFSNVGFKIDGTFSKPTVKLDLENTLNAVVDDVKQQVQAEVDKKVDEAKQKLDEELTKQKEKAIKEAQTQADKLRDEAKKAGDKLVGEARLQGQKLVDGTSNAITKKAAEVSAQRLVEEAQKQADRLYQEADKQGKELVKKTEEL